MWYAVLIDADPRKGIPLEPVPARVVAHNLDREAAEKLKTEMRASATVAGDSLATVFVWGYDALHSAESPDDCIECSNLVANHHRELLRLFEAEAAKRGIKLGPSPDELGE